MIPAHMSIIVVDLFEVIQIGHHNAENRPIAPCSLDPLLQSSENDAAVPHARQRIARGLSPCGRSSTRDECEEPILNGNVGIILGRTE